jgi:putative flippase GtrA
MFITQIGATAAIIGFAIAIFASFYLDTAGTYGETDRENKMNIVDRTVVGGFAMFFIGILTGLIGLVWGI